MLQCGGMIGQATAVDATEVQHPLEDDANPNSKTCNARPAPDPQKLQRRREQVFRKPSESVQKESETCRDVNERDLRGKDYFS